MPFITSYMVKFRTLGSRHAKDFLSKTRCLPGLIEVQEEEMDPCNDSHPRLAQQI